MNLQNIQPQSQSDIFLPVLNTLVAEKSKTVPEPGVIGGLIAVGIGSLLTQKRLS